MSLEYALISGMLWLMACTLYSHVYDSMWKLAVVVSQGITLVVKSLPQDRSRLEYLDQGGICRRYKF